MSRIFLYLLCSFILTFNLCNGYSRGAPARNGVCSTLIPGHGKKQTGENPYRFRIDPNDQSDINITLLAVAKVTFAGFIVQARDAEKSDQIVNGQFLDNKDSHGEICSNDKTKIYNTWTHSGASPKTEIQTTWKPPPHYNGSIIFHGTVVQVKDAYWSDITSEPVYFLNAERVDEETFREYQKDFSQSEPLTGNGLPYSKCQEYVCMGLSDTFDCAKSESCQMLFLAKQSSGLNKFIISSKQENPISKYFSIAFSDDSQMGDDVVVDCLVDSRGAVKMGVSTNVGKTNKLSMNDNKILHDVEVKSVDGVVTCKWTMANKFQVNGRKISLADKNYHFLLAVGELENDSGEKGYHDQRIPGVRAVNLSSIDFIESKDTTYLIKVHGAFMILSWIGTVSIGIMFARYFKDSWPNTLLGGVKIWFAFHRPLMMFSVILMCIAQVCIFYYVGEYRVGYHQVIGSIAFLFAIMQPLGALCRPHPDSSSRWIFNWAHWFGGNCGQILAVTAILLAIRLKSAKLPQIFLYVVLAWITFHVFVHLVLQIHIACSSKSKTSDIALHELHNGQAIYIDNSSKQSGQAFRSFILFIYSVFTILFCALLITLVFKPDSIQNFY